jgi:hypothetical protein
MYALIVAIKVTILNLAFMEPAEALAEQSQKRQTLAGGAAQNGCRVVHFRASDPRNCPRPEPIANAKVSKSPIIGRLLIRHATCLSICCVISNPSFRRRLDGLMQTSGPCSFSSGELEHEHPLLGSRKPQEGFMFRSTPVVASKTVGGEKIHAEFLCDTGRLRIIGGVTVRAEWFPPHSWFAIASVAGYSRWGTRPDETDLLRLIENFMRLPGRSAL